MGALDILSNIGSAIGLGSDDNKPPKMVKSTGFDGKSSVDMPEGALSMTDTKAPSGLSDFIPMTGPKGSKTYMDPKSSEAILQKMQDFVDQRTSNQSNWDNRLADAQAWTIGDAGQKAQALKGRQEIATTQAKDVQDMQMQIAQFRAAQERNKAYNEMLKGTYGTQPQTTGGAPQTGGASQAGGDPQTVTTASGQRFAFSSLPPEIQAAARSQIDPEAFQKVITEWAAEHAKGAQKIAGEINVQGRDYVTVKGPNGTEYPSLKKDVPALIAKLYPNGVGSEDVVSAPTTAPDTTAEATAPGFDARKSYGTPAKLLDNLSATESSHDPFAINPDSKALGRYQFTPETAAMLHKQGIKFNPFDADESRAAADYYIQKLVKQNGGDYTKAMMQYGGFKKADPTKYLSQVMNGVDLNNSALTAQAPTAQAPTAQGSPTRNIELNAQIQQLITSIPKPSPNANAAQWEKYHNTIDQLKGNLGAAPIQSAQAANKTTEVARATNSAINEKSAIENASLYNTTYKSALDKLESFANNKANDPLFAIGDRQGDLTSKAYNLAIHLGVDPTAARNTVILNDSRISNSQRAGMSEFDSLKNQIVSAYVHQTFPGRILASELTLGDKAKGVSLESQRESNARSLASIRNVFEISDKLVKGYAKYRDTPGHENTLYDDYVRSKEATDMIRSSNEVMMRKFPGAYTKAEPSAEDKFAKYKKV